MDCNEVKINLPEFIDGKLNKSTSDMVSKHLETCASCRELHRELKSFLQFAGSFPEPEPPAGMKEEFMQMAELEREPKGRAIRIPAWAKVAAMVLIVFGTFASGYFTGSKNNEVGELKAEMGQLKQDVMLAGLRDYSGPQKIQAVYDIQSSGQASETFVDALVHTMNSDKNVNVRLAAISALSEMMDKNEAIKTELIKSLSVQDNPLLQISLIQVLTESGVKEAKDEIESISNDENTDQHVKEYANSMIKTII
ncbi:zf-HC2 domain-containing protein [Draconibacterium sp. IB214405]|uniref:zf-HC2 domain-containing protein n=1 Tax=Draconibacterium sp. IB214405 TaxID=3097352 RepID=UPI002A152B3D|nr:zf-HC2 domain-containing protein [Draconibacterium sp. IB214405]MDX8338211.1 zf-HC2 domain-containing protein [Draconibacterium sp. IB214405]